MHRRLQEVSNNFWISAFFSSGSLRDAACSCAKLFNSSPCARLLCEGIVSCNRIRNLAGLDLLSGETQLGYSPISCWSGLSEFGENLLGFVFLFLLAEVFGAENSAPAVCSAAMPAFEELVTTDREKKENCTGHDQAIVVVPDFTQLLAAQFSCTSRNRLSPSSAIVCP